MLEKVGLLSIKENSEVSFSGIVVILEMFIKGICILESLLLNLVTFHTPISRCIKYIIVSDWRRLIKRMFSYIFFIEFSLPSVLSW